MRTVLPQATVEPFRAHAWPLTRQQSLAAVAAVMLAAIVFGALMIGPRPFAVQAADKAAISESGSAFNRLVIFLSFALAVPVAALHLERFAQLLLRNWLVVAIALWSFLSFLWASHPDLVIRRGFAFVLVYLMLLGIVSGARSATDMLWPLVIVFTAISVLNLVAMIVFPASSWSPIGENGIFDNKNSAGTMAMLAILFVGTGFLAVNSAAMRITLGIVLLMGTIFLFATKSKTSIGVTFLMLLAGPSLYGLIGSRPALRLLAVVGGVACIVAGTVAYVAAGYDDKDLRLLLFGDLTFTGRTEIWQHIVVEIARRPWLGHGFGSFWDTGALVNPILSGPPGAWFMNAQLINTAHNGYLDTLLQTGTIGLGLAVAAILRCLWLLLAGASGTARGERIALTGALCVVVALVLNNFLESYLFRPGDTLGYLFIFLMLHAELVRYRLTMAKRLHVASQQGRHGLL